MSFFDKVGFWGSICSIVGVIIIFLPSFNAPDQKEEKVNNSYGDKNIIIRGDGNSINYDSKEKSRFNNERANGIREYFGFYAGNYWVYQVGNITTKEGKKREVVTSSYKNSILLVNHNYDLSSGIVTVKQDGNELYAYCETKNKSKVFWYVYNKVHVFRVCDYDQAEMIYEKISKNNYFIDSLEDLEAKLLYEFPLEIGNAWWSQADDSNAENIENNINWYTFYLSKKIPKIHTPAGEFKNCNEISENILSSSYRTYICENVGFVSSNSKHNGTTDVGNVQLIEYKLKKTTDYSISPITKK